MKITEKIQYSADKTRFTFFKEELFYKCYNEDAMVFVKAYPHPFSLKVSSYTKGEGLPL